LQLLEGAAPSSPVAGRHLDRLLNFLLGLGHERSDIPTAHIGCHNHTPLAVFTADLTKPYARHHGGRSTKWFPCLDHAPARNSWPPQPGYLEGEQEQHEEHKEASHGKKLIALIYENNE